MQWPEEAGQGSRDGAFEWASARGGGAPTGDNELLEQKSPIYQWFPNFLDL